MIRGTSHQFKFDSPYSVERIKEIRILFWQDDYSGTAECPLPILKEKDSCVLNEYFDQIFVSLNQLETFAFTETKRGHVQFRAVLDDGIVFGSKDTEFVVYPMKDDAIMG